MTHAKIVKRLEDSLQAMPAHVLRVGEVRAIKIDDDQQITLTDGKVPPGRYVMASVDVIVPLPSDA